MDAIDHQILQHLQRNARMPLSELGRAISMTQPAVSERVRKLEEKGIIDSYRAIVSPEKLGKAVTAFVLVQTGSCGKLAKFGGESPEVAEMHQLSGQYNFILKVQTRSIASLEAFLVRCSEFGFTTTMTVLSTPLAFKPLSEEADGFRAI
ncbi:MULTISPECIES: Lrp/AsnC family transcriptional regulator [unclassified Paenibacillus]|uniref:Lrp/AsnC family transcriptional regulator n=1 Tax=unclassified Paenibacillus TaxID=185978 RepID=UPI0009553AE5|nr:MULTISPECIES: Lrp/AsnC family transcriptional regulator [unclassified Paenibacillus]ASS64787.1 Lrp/AsnC family transcriptional regulator [Paenibacillus sp. RUD330]SIR06021.1 DNA-binding transcriptional regulator, Lrp family [Paenibacillus sp. RU4X]SIR29437.1 DNA-binding transcriptional regulator, Lrp family [Paenibacillus sp. RU4T]